MDLLGPTRVLEIDLFHTFLERKVYFSVGVQDPESCVCIETSVIVTSVTLRGVVGEVLSFIFDGTEHSGS